MQPSSSTEYHRTTPITFCHSTTAIKLWQDFTGIELRALPAEHLPPRRCWPLGHWHTGVFLNLTHVDLSGHLA